MSTWLLTATFWCCALGVAYAYFGYPVIIGVLSRVFGRTPEPAQSQGPLPRVALLIVAHNEADILKDRIENALALDYPRDRLQIVIASDGSDDHTIEVCARYADRIRLLAFPERRGKPAALSAAIGALDAEIVILSDANTLMDSQAALRLARWFADQTVGFVCGRLILTDPESGRNSDSLYWRYESFLKACEGRLGALLGANGAIYALRTSSFVPLPPGTIVDDFVIPLAARLRTGCRTLHDPQAVAYEVTAPDLGAEFRRRARIGTGAWASLGSLWPLLSPRHGWTAFALWSHKVLRWVCPFLLVGALVCSALLSDRMLYRSAFAAQAAFYLLAAIPPLLPSVRPLRRLRLCSMFAAMNLALLVGFFRWLRGDASGVWQRTARAAERSPA
jgi:cellulose synthase/poly-beta-1,6-N-acetylglucosamine synthase-like glycosyltransferase